MCKARNDKPVRAICPHGHWPAHACRDCTPDRHDLARIMRELLAIVAHGAAIVALVVLLTCTSPREEDSQ